MLIPRQISEISKEWLEHVLNEYEIKSRGIADDTSEKWTVINFEKSAATKPGDSFNSDLICVDLEATKSDKTESFHWILKLESRDVFCREFNRLAMTQKTEFQIYSEFHKDMENWACDKGRPKYKLCIPKFYYGICENNDYVIVMENMKALGYSVNDKMKGLGLDELRLCIQQLAYCHALSYSYDKEKGFPPDFKQKERSDATKSLIVKVFGPSSQNLIKLLEQNDSHKDLQERLKKFKSIIREFKRQLDNVSRGPVLCLTHGDYWNNNVLFKYFEDEANEISVIDWQMSSWSTPVLDLHYLFMTSTTLEVRRAHRETLLKEYHKTFSDVTKDLGVSMINWSYEQFTEEYNKYELSGLLFGLALCQGTLSKGSNKVNSPENCSNPRSFGTKVKAGLCRGFMKMMTSPMMDPLVSVMFAKILKPVEEEILAGTNPVLNKRLLELGEEAEERGTFNFLDNE